jgi:hypothetical protein
MKRCSLTTFAVIAVLASAAFGSSAQAARRSELVLAKSPEDPALIARLVALSPNVNPEEARRVAHIAYTTGRELAQKWKMFPSPTIHSFLINMGLKKAGFCYQYATELALRLDAENLRTLEQHWAESDPGTDTEHNVIAITAKGQPFEQGIMLDNWREAGRLLWGPLTGDPSHTWQENKSALAKRIPRKPAPADRPANPKKTDKPPVERAR